MTYYELLEYLKGFPNFSLSEEVRIYVPIENQTSTYITHALKLDNNDLVLGDVKDFNV